MGATLVFVTTSVCLFLVGYYIGSTLGFDRAIDQAYHAVDLAERCVVQLEACRGK